MPRKLVLFGTGGCAREVEQLVKDLNAREPTWDFLGWLDGNPERHGGEIHARPVLGGAEWLNGRPEVHVALCIGNTAAKRRVYLQLRAQGHDAFATLIHPTAVIGDTVRIGEGVIICAGCIANCDIVIGDQVMMNIGSTLGHDAVLGDFVMLNPSVNVSGNVNVGEGADLGTGTAVVQGNDVGAWSILGAGTVVCRDVPPNVTAVGIPARVIKERAAGWHLG